MLQKSRKHGSANGRIPQPDIAVDESLTAPRHEIRHTTPADDEQHHNVRIPFYDDPNHVAHSWQQMMALPDLTDLHTYIRGTEDDPPVSPGGQAQSWPLEQQRERKPATMEQSGFNPYPRRGQGPRRPPPLTEAKDKSLYHRQTVGRAKLRPFVDFRSTEREGEGVEAAAVQEHLARRALHSKDVNRKLRNKPNKGETSPVLRLTGGLRKGNQHSRSRRLVVDEVATSQHEDKQSERMPALPEEPSPLRIRKAYSRSNVVDQPRKLRSEQKNEEAEYPS